ncbi:uncharacterized protein LOC116004820 [Ipomoea triloba]|uniref:uncharacterized protein LOC116004820 n=1 Tax=Ipomoea triloba TaxID=35885 RepID=UPI00125E076E|nr:uncharacterized protein LOC116004820 [Ipomoea triloba]
MAPDEEVITASEDVSVLGEVVEENEFVLIMETHFKRLLTSGSTNREILPYDPEIERTLRNLRKQARRKLEFSALATDSPSSSHYDLEEKPMAQNRTLKELGAPNLDQQPLCITFPALDANVQFELKSGLIHLLPSFHGLAGFSAAKDWIYYLPSGSIATWNDLKTVFLEKYFPASRAANIIKEICGIRSMIDATSGGALVDKIPDVAKNLIANMAANSQQFGNRLVQPSKQINEVSISNLEQQVAGLTTLVRQLAVGNMQTVKACGICSVVGHQTDACPTLQEEPIEHVNAAGGFPGQPQGKYDPFSNSYNPGWRDHPNLSYGNSQGNQIVQNRSNFQQYRQPFPSRQPPAQSSNSGMNLEDIVKSLAINTLQFQQETQLFQQDTKSNFQETKVLQMLPPSVDQEKEGTNNNENSQSKFPSPSDYKPTPPFPQALSESKKEAKDVELYETFKNCEVNIPLLDAIKQVPRYAKFLKELCTTKRKQK